MADIQIRGVPAQVRDAVKRRARKQGRSMSEYLLSIIQRDLSVPTPDEFAQRLEKLSRVRLDRPVAHHIEQIRKERDAEIDPRNQVKRRKSS